MKQIAPSLPFRVYFYIRLLYSSHTFFYEFEPGSKQFCIVASLFKTLSVESSLIGHQV